MSLADRLRAHGVSEERLRVMGLITDAPTDAPAPAPAPVAPPNPFKEARERLENSK